ncbi:lasso RiPP family leader peptide-containing protein [Streptomyces sp. TRM70308]
MEQTAMEQTVKVAEYQPPAVVDAGEAAEVTLGTAAFDSADDTQYRI